MPGLQVSIYRRPGIVEKGNCGMEKSREPVRTFSPGKHLRRLQGHPAGAVVSFRLSNYITKRPPLSGGTSPINLIKPHDDECNILSGGFFQESTQPCED